MTDAIKEKESKMYEIAVLVKEDGTINAIRSIIEKAGLSVSQQTEPKRLMLAYPIHKEHSADFVVMHCVAHGETTMPQMRKELEVEPSCLRFLVTTYDPSKQVRDERPATDKPSGKMFDQAPAPSSQPERKGDVVSNEELEKKLEEILQ